MSLRIQKRGEFSIPYSGLLLLLGLVVVVLSYQPVRGAGSVTGVVFRDYNENGQRDLREPGVPNIRVTAYDSTGTPVGTAATIADGTYTLAWTGPDTSVRLEFTNIPEGFEPGAFGADSPTTVQFATTGDVVNVGINRPSQYCQENPNFATSCFNDGDQITGPNANDPVLVIFPNNATGATSATNNTYLANSNQMGTVFGLTYRRATNMIYAASYYKRGAGFGPGGIGAIYSVPEGGGPVDIVANFGAAAGVDSHGNYPVDGSTYPTPPNSYANVGKMAFGDLDMGEDDVTMWVVNLYNRSLYTVNSLTGAFASRGVVPDPGCVNGVGRPFGLADHDGLIYVGGVCTAENGGTVDDLQAYVYSFNPRTSVYTLVLQFPLNYPRGCADVKTPPQPTCRTGTNGTLADWRPWSDVWPNPASVGNDVNGYFSWPQPMLTDIEFDNDQMILAFRDRMADQIGAVDPGPQSPQFNPLVNAIPAGDILRASPDGSGGWIIENNAESDPPGAFGPTGGANNEQGPGDGEFFNDGFSGGGSTHDETILGGLAQIPGDDVVVATIFDPFSLFSAGIRRYDHTTGLSVSAYEVVPPNQGAFGKANGLGELEALCGAAPIEVGNRVWEDLDVDGIQDPDEIPLANVTVELFDPATNTVIDTAVTDALGTYYFSSYPAGTTTASARYNIPFQFNTNYQVRIDLTQPAIAGPGYYVTASHTGMGSDPDLNDSDGVQAGTWDVHSFTTGGAGQNNHTYDFGFSLTPPAQQTPTPPAPGVGIESPRIAKQVNPPFAMPGQIVTWTMTVFNHNTVPVGNVSFTDSVPSDLEILSASASAGSVQVSGQKVTFAIDPINAGETITVTVETQLRTGISIPFLITNTANMEPPYVGSASASLASVTMLPATGEEPWWRVPILIGAGGLLVGAGTLWYRRRARASP
jgi:uncharacterized repeat protein (TIGR01451 family)